jgi:hypothetical protein
MRTWFIRAGQLDHACTAARWAVDYTADTTSFPAAHRISMMLAEFQPRLTVPAVADVTEYARFRLPIVPTLTSTATR